MPNEQSIATNEQLEKAIEIAVANYMSDVAEDIHEMRRAIVGAPQEGNLGILKRMSIMERRVAILMWLLPVWVTAGTGLGQYLVALWGT